MRLKNIHRTSTFAWSPASVLPLLATGTVAGALDENFSNEGTLEIWAPDFREEGEETPKGTVTTTSRFNKLAWGNVSSDRPRGIIAAGMESGELGLWDPSKIVQSADPSESQVLNNKKHTNAVRGLDFNMLHTNLLASGAAAGEIYIWDLTNPTKPYTPTGNAAANPKLDLITSLAWNSSVAHVLASSSSTGYTVVWDLRGKREVAALAYGGGAATGSGAVGGGREMEIGRRRGMSDVCWQPDNPTRIITSSEDDTSPIIMLWDLRNSRAPEKILTGHEKGVLSVSWCKQDADLLLSCGKDNRTLCWNPSSGEIIGELPSANNWAFQVDWCPRNPDLLATASFDGTIGLHSLQSTNDESAASQQPPRQATGADIFDLPSTSDQPKATLSLKQPPKWLRRPTSVSFGFGGKLVSVKNDTAATAHGHGKGTVSLRTVVTEESILARLQAMKTAEEEGKSALQEFVEARTGESVPEGEAKETWRALASLFRADSRDELITLLGFSKDEVRERVKAAIEKLKLAPPAQSTSIAPTDMDRETSEPLSEPTVTFADEHEEIIESEGPPDATTPDPDTDTGEAPSEVSVGATSDGTKLTTAVTEADTETTEPSLFGEDIGPIAPGGAGTPAAADAADFFSSMGGIRSALPERVLVPHHSYAYDSSQAATVGSRSSSIADLSETPLTRGGNTFKIYPNEESDVDRLVTKALVLGDFASAVELCLSAERFADAILLAVKGGADLLQSTQKAYFEKRTTELPYLRLFQSIVSNDLTDVVQNADLREWQEIFVVVCTFAKADEFAGLAEQLGQRLEFQSRLIREDEEGKKELRRHATLCYLVAGRLEKLVGIWAEEMKEEEEAASSADGAALSTYDAHAAALQTFIEKITVFRGATSYVDTDLAHPTESEAVAESGARTYRLASLYERYYEYADLIASQGSVNEAVRYVAMTPADYRGTPGEDGEFDVIRDRLLKAANVQDNQALFVKQQEAKTVVSSRDPGYFPQGHQAPPASQYSYSYANGVPAGGPTANNPYAPPAPPAGSTSGYPSAAPPPPPKAGPYPPTAPMQYPSNSWGSSSYGQPAYPPPPPAGIVPPPPPPIEEEPPPHHEQLHIGPPPRGGHIKREATPGWNDAPHVDRGPRAAPAPLAFKAPAAITSPFPNAPMPATPGSPYAHPVHQPMSLPPPPSRSGSISSAPPPAAGVPPPRAGMPPPPRRGESPGMPTPAVRTGPPGQPQQQPSRLAPGAPGLSAQPPNFTSPPMRALSPLAHGSVPPGARPPVRALSPAQPGQLRQPMPPPPRQGQGGMPAPARQPPPQNANGATPGAPPGARPPHGQASWPAPGARGTPPPQPTGPYAPPPSRPGPPTAEGTAPPPPGQGPSRTQTPSAQAPPPKSAPVAPKYPAGDRSHIPDPLKPVYSSLSREVNQMKQTTPPQQKRLVDDTERRLNILFDALNCESLSPPVVQQLQSLVRAVDTRDIQTAMNLHVRLVTSGAPTDNVATWGPGIKQLLNRMMR